MRSVLLPADGPTSNAIRLVVKYAYNTYPPHCEQSKTFSHFVGEMLELLISTW